MSITFELLEAVEVFPLAKLRERSGLPELECSELIGEELSAAFLSNISHVYLPGVTCFSPELSYDKSSRHYSVRMVAASCSVDYDLAFEIITALSSTKHSRVSCGEDRGTPVSELRSVYTADWV